VREKALGERRHGARREHAEVLPGLHQAEVHIGHEAEHIERLREHLAVLRGGDEQRLQERLMSLAVRPRPAPS
jgi:hypothetical protein